MPRFSRFTVLWNPANEASALAWKENQDQARTLGLTTISGPVASPADLEPALAAVAAQRPDGLFVHLVLSPYRTRIIEFALSHRIPTMSADRRWAEAGVLLTYGAHSQDIYRRAAIYVDKILKGATPGDLPVEQPTKFELAINLNTAKALGLTIPPSLLARADRVIE